MKGAVMKVFFLVFLLLFLSSCYRAVTLVNPGTGQTVKCEGGGVGPIGGSIKAALVDRCVEEHERSGYVRTDKLTSEQKAKLNMP
jgi:hypothetical protein